MSERQPNEEDQIRIPGAETGPAAEVQDDPELPTEERLQRAARRFEARVHTWEQQTLIPDLEPQLDEIDAWLGHAQKIIDHPERRRVGATAFAESRMNAVETDVRRQASREARRSARIGQLTKERQRQRADKKVAIRRNQVLAYHGAAAWCEQPDNATRLHELHEAINRQRLGIA